MGRARPGRIHRGSRGLPLLIIEGDGAGRQEVADLIDALIWVQSDQREAGQRSLARAGKPDPMDLANTAADGSPFDEDGWMAEEMPFNAAQRTWERADVIVCGTPKSPATPPPRSSSRRPDPRRLTPNKNPLGTRPSAKPEPNHAQRN